jgi:hypothetical protein
MEGSPHIELSPWLLACYQFLLPAFLEIAEMYIAATRKRVVDKANRPFVREVITIIVPTGREQVPDNVSLSLYV